MSERRKPTPEEVAKGHNYHLWNVSQRNRTIYVGRSSPTEAANNVNNFASLYPLYASEPVRERYRSEVDKQYAQQGLPPLWARIEILQGAVESVISEHILGDDKENAEKQKKLQDIKADLGDFYDRLWGISLEDKNVKHPEFVRILETNREVEVDGLAQEMEVKAVCPAAGMARQLYWDFEKIIEYNPLEDHPQK